MGLERKLRIVATSDMHIESERNGLKAVEHATEISQLIADVLVVIGDIGTPKEDVENVLKELGKFPGEKLYVLGNHDLINLENSKVPFHIDELNELLNKYDFHLLDNKPKDVINELISCIQNLKIISCDSLKVQAIIDNGVINFNSLEKPESSYFDPKNNELTLTRPISKTYVKILKPLLYSLIPKSDDNELRNLLSTFDSICDKDYLVAESYLDDLDFKKLEEIETDELIHESGKYDYIPDEIQSDGSEEEGDFTEITHDSNQDSNEEPIDNLLETDSSKEEVDDLPDTISISENEESNSQNKENDREKERRNPREFKNDGDSPGQQGSKGKPNNSPHQSTEKTFVYTKNKDDKTPFELVENEPPKTGTPGFFFQEPQAQQIEIAAVLKQLAEEGGVQ